MINKANLRHPESEYYFVAMWVRLRTSKPGGLIDWMALCLLAKLCEAKLEAAGIRGTKAGDPVIVLPCGELTDGVLFAAVTDLRAIEIMAIQPKDLIVAHVQVAAMDFAEAVWRVIVPEEKSEERFCPWFSLPKLLLGANAEARRLMGEILQ